MRSSIQLDDDIGVGGRAGSVHPVHGTEAAGGRQHVLDELRLRRAVGLGTNDRHKVIWALPLTVACRRVSAPRRSK